MRACVVIRVLRKQAQQPGGEMGPGQIPVDLYLRIHMLLRYDVPYAAQST